MDGESLYNMSAMKGSYRGFQNSQKSMQASGRWKPRPFQGLMASSNVQARRAFPVWNGSVQKSDVSESFLDGHGKAHMTTYSGDDDSSYAAGEHVDWNNKKEKNESPWQRVKWTDEMVKLLITAVSYIGEDAGSNCGGGKRVISLKKGKWRAISKVMEERGVHVSPQQCEDKFNDLNKRYKKLNEILGSGTSCEVVENPALLDFMDTSDESKENVRKILSSKQLFYQEMCSYHNGNRQYIPHDQAIQRSLHLALRDSDDLDSCEAKTVDDDLGSSRVCAKRKKPVNFERLDSDYNLDFHTATKKSAPCNHARRNQVSGQGTSGDGQGNQWFMSRTRQLEEQKLLLKAEMLELEKQRLRWLRFSELEDKKLEKMRLENMHLKLVNERFRLEIKHREMRGGAN